MQARDEWNRHRSQRSDGAFGCPPARRTAIGILALAAASACSAAAGTAASAAPANSFQGQIDAVCPAPSPEQPPGEFPNPDKGDRFLARLAPLQNCGSGPTTTATGGQVVVQNDGISATQRREIEARLKQLRCDARGGAGCPEAAAASEDSQPVAGFSAFVTGEYESKDRAETAFEPGYDSNRFGVTVGLDHPLGSSAVIGGALTFARTDAEFDNGGGDFDIDSYGGFLYGSYYPSDQSFIDAVVGFAFKDYSTSRLAINGDNQATGFADGDTSGFEFNASLSGGYDFSFDAFTIGPRVGVHYKRTEIDGFSETGTTPLALSYEDQVEESLTSTLGFQASYAISTDFGVIVPQVSAEYVHEFLDDRRSVDASFVDEPAVTIRYITDKPDRDYLNVGAGVVLVLPDGLSPYLNYAAELANSREQVHTVSLGLRAEF